MEEDYLPEDDPAVEYWIPFIQRMEKIPMDYQMAILDEYEKAENTGHEMKVDKMWDLLLAGEDKARLIARGAAIKLKKCPIGGGLIGRLFAPFQQRAGEGQSLGLPCTI